MADVALVEVPKETRPAAAVLVVNDREAQRLAVRAMLAPLGLTVVEADSGRAALRAVMRQTFAVILMDVRMPTMDGYETAKLIRQRRQSGHTPIIFSTAFGRDETETLTAYASGAVDFIFTPIHGDVLRAKVSALVALFVQSQELQTSLESITDLNAALRDSEVRARAVLQNVADGIITAGKGGRIESFNRSARRLFGYREEEVIGQPMQLLIAPSHHYDFSGPMLARRSPPAAQDRAVASLAVRGGDGSPAETTQTVGRRRDGSCFPMEIDVSQIQIGERSLTIGCVRDISGRNELKQAQFEMLARLAAAAEFHDDETGEHTRRVGDLSVAIAERLGLPEAQIHLIRLAAPLHDVGKIAIPDAVLGKPGKLTKKEFEQMKTHSAIGAEMLSGSVFELLEVAEEIALTHHEKWDGSGYPAGLAGDAIPISGRIVAVADVFDALTHSRPYKPAWSTVDAIAEMTSQSGLHFDPTVLEAFLGLPRPEAATNGVAPVTSIV
jgi:PAS domain S-box-containing protein